MNDFTTRRDQAERLLKVAAVAQYFDIDEDLVYRLIHSGQLRAIRLGRLWRVPESALGEFIASGGDNRAEQERQQREQLGARLHRRPRVDPAHVLRADQELILAALDRAEGRAVRHHEIKQLLEAPVPELRFRDALRGLMAAGQVVVSGTGPQTRFQLDESEVSAS